MAQDPVFDLGQKDNMGYIMESGILVEDGADQEFTVFREGQYRTFLYSNLPTYKKYLDNYPQAKAALKLMEKMTRTARKNTQLNL